MRVGGNFISSFGEQNNLTGAPIAPNQDHFKTVVLPPKIVATNEDFSKLLDTDNSIAISGIIIYDGLYGSGYETRFCISRLKTGAIQFNEPSENCQNEIK
jgi:hypothetical protein